MNDLISQIERWLNSPNRGEYLAVSLFNGDLAELVRLAKLGQQRDWIPVTPETMPEVGKKVLARLKFFASETVRHYELIHVKEDDCTWRTVDDGSEVAYEWNVTHYMIIPALPEQEG